MGCLFHRSSSSTYDKRPAPQRVEVVVKHEHAPAPKPKPLPNPDPFHFRILDSYQCSKALAIKVRYPDCTNYEGVKVMVYRTATVFKLRRQAAKVGLDPHMSSSKTYLSPFARFEPTPRGWRAACSLADSLPS